MIRRLGFALLLALGTLGAVELGTRAALAVLGDRWPSVEELRRELEGDTEESAPSGPSPPTRRAGNLLHPYVGFVRDAAIGPERQVNALLVEDPVNELGFFGPSPLTPKPDDVARVALTGGSVAEELYLYGRETLRSELQRLGAFGGRRVEILSLALAGFKQPQQLAALSYALVLGAPLDAVINLDGFNEVVLPFTDNQPLGLSLTYPFRWNTVAAPGIDPDTAVQVAAVAAASARIDALRNRFRGFPLRQSAAALLTWHWLNESALARRAAAEVALRQQLGHSDALTPQERGPAITYPDSAALFEDAAAVWERASRQMHSLCEDRGIAYLHFLQPNQYVPDSKPFTPAERKRAVLATRNSTRAAAEAGLPMLIERGARLRAEGFPFFDLSALFAGETEPVYRDACCHYLQRGYDLVAEAIARELAATLTARPATSAVNASR